MGQVDDTGYCIVVDVAIGTQTVAWITAPNAAASDAITLHIVHSHGVRSNTFTLSAAFSLNIPLPYTEWLSKPSEELEIRTYSEINMEKAQATNSHIGPCSASTDLARIGPEWEWEPLGIARLETKRAVRVSSLLTK